MPTNHLTDWREAEGVRRVCMGGTSSITFVRYHWSIFRCTLDGGIPTEG